MAATETKAQPINDVLEVGEHKYNARLVKDNGDGSLVVEHSVYTGKGKERKFLGNVTTLIYAHSDAGYNLLRDALADRALADKVTHDRNRQAMSDSKNAFRSDETRPQQPLNQLKKKLKEGLPADQLAKVKAAFAAVGVDITSLTK